MGKYQDLTGQVFGEWTVLKRDDEWDKIRDKPVVKWVCKCSCGTIRSVTGSNLRQGLSQSCGCKKIEKFQKTVQNWNQKKKEEDIFCIKQDLTNKQFDNVLVLGIDIEKSRKAREKHGKLAKIYWKCKCLNCGNEFSPAGGDLMSGQTKSCGCIRKQQSKGAQKIEKLLKENNIKYRKEVTFPELRDINLLRFDFALLDKNDQIIKLIEFDGQQHFQSSSSLYSTPILKKHDNMKNEFAQINHIPLLRVSYLEIENINIDKLLKEANF